PARVDLDGDGIGELSGRLSLAAAEAADPAAGVQVRDDVAARDEDRDVAVRAGRDVLRVGEVDPAPARDLLAGRRLAAVEDLSVAREDVERADPVELEPRRPVEDAHLERLALRAERALERVALGVEGAHLARRRLEDADAAGDR